MNSKKFRKRYKALQLPTFEEVKAAAIRYEKWLADVRGSSEAPSADRDGSYASRTL